MGLGVLRPWVARVERRGFGHARERTQGMEYRRGFGRAEAMGTQGMERTMGLH